MSKAYVTLLTNDQYLPGCLVLATSLRLSGTTLPILCAITRDVSTQARAHLALLFDDLVQVDQLDSGDHTRFPLSLSLSLPPFLSL